jgi:hypothetical protein
VGFGAPETMAFVAAMLAGMIVARQSGGLLAGLKWNKQSPT